MPSMRAASARLPALLARARRINISSSRAVADGRSSSGQSIAPSVAGSILVDEAEIGRIDDIAAHQHRGALDRVLQLADIPGPCMADEPRRGIRRRAAWRRQLARESARQGERCRRYALAAPADGSAPHAADRTGLR